jgi:hypothetical protein
MHRLACALTIVLPLAAAGTAEPSLSSGSASACREAGASFALGARYSDRLARRARRAADARILRKIEPGRAYTMEFQADRLNIEVDRRGRIRAVRCG